MRYLPLLTAYPLWRIAHPSPRKGSHLPLVFWEGWRPTARRNSAKLRTFESWHFEWTDDNSMAEFRMAEGEKVVVVKIIINFSWIGKCIEYYKKLHFSTHSRRINPISLKRSTPTKHDILAAILSRGSRLQRDRVAAMNVTRVPLKFFKETVDRVSWRSDVGPLRLFHRWNGKSLFAGRV